MSLSPEMVNGFFAAGGAVAGAIIAGLFAIYTAKSTKEKKEIVVSTSYASSLLDVDDQIASNVEILVSGNKVENILLSEIFLSNTGNKAVENLNFPISCQPNVQIISIDALDKATGAPHSGTGIAKISSQKYDVTIDYINPGEAISLRCIVSGVAPEWSIGLRQPNVYLRDKPAVGYTDVLAEVLFESFAGNPFLSVYLKLAFPAYRKFLKNRS